MKASSKWRVSAVVLIAALTVGLAQVAEAGFGISPPAIKETNLVKGSVLDKTIYIVQGDPDRAIGLDIQVDSADMASWISFPNGKEAVIPAGVQQFPLLVRVTVPQDVELGVYKAFIRISTKPERVEGGGQVALALGGRIDVDLTVGDGVLYQYTVRGIEVLDIDEGGDPKIKVKIQNTGNVPAAPDNASFELFNKYGNIRLAYAENDNFVKIGPFSEGTAELEFPIDVRLAEGEYWGNVRVYNDQGGVVKEAKTVFNVNRLTLLQKLTRPSSIAIAAFILLVVMFLLFMLRRNRRRR